MSTMLSPRTLNKAQTWYRVSENLTPQQQKASLGLIKRGAIGVHVKKPENIKRMLMHHLL
jgi:hypothetical protein